VILEIGGYYDLRESKFPVVERHTEGRP
jgi:hypothetical protein